jgi:hypothetical protein
MTKTMKSEEVRSQWRDVIDDVLMNQAEIVVERYSKPTVAIIPYAQWQAFKRHRKARHDRILAEMDAGQYATWEAVKAELLAEGILA